MHVNVLTFLLSFFEVTSQPLCFLFVLFFSCKYCRYVGKDYSSAQEQMEDEMKAYYNQNSTVSPAQSLSVGQLVAVHAEEDAWLRARIISLEDNRVKASNYLSWHSEKELRPAGFFRYTVNS